MEAVVSNALSFLASYAGVMGYIALGVTVLVFVVAMTVNVLNRRWLHIRPTEWLEITPPASVNKTPEATEQLFSVIHGHYAARSLKDKLLRRLPVMSFEIASTRKDGIRYLVQVESSQSLTFQKAITAYVPNAKVSVVDYQPPETMRTLEFKETGHYVLPLTLTAAFEQHDPLSYVTAAMTKLSDGESVTLQLVIRPVKLKDASKLSRQIMANENVLSAVNGGGNKALSKAGDLLGGTLMGALDLASEVSYETAAGYRNGSSRSSYAKDAQFKSQVARGERPARTLSKFELELMESMHQKVTQPLFQVDLRVLISGSTAKAHAAAFRSALDGYSVPPHQALKAKTNLPLTKNRRKKLADARLPAYLKRNGLVLSSSEVASLYHFPSSRISQTDNLITSLSRTLPAPVSLKQNRKLDVIIGENIHHDTVTPIGLTQLERDRHVYIIGGTGNGKTTMIKYQLIQDIKNNKGVAIVDPHGDLAEELLGHIPPERIDDVVYFNPDDLEHPFALNLLELTPGLTGDDLLREKDIITESVVSVFRKIFSDDDSGGHRIEYVLRNAIHTALTVEGATVKLSLFRTPTLDS